MGKMTAAIRAPPSPAAQRESRLCVCGIAWLSRRLVGNGLMRLAHVIVRARAREFQAGEDEMIIRFFHKDGLT